jgi:hypothetical protein
LTLLPSKVRSHLHCFFLFHPLLGDSLDGLRRLCLSLLRDPPPCFGRCFLFFELLQQILSIRLSRLCFDCHSFVTGGMTCRRCTGQHCCERGIRAFARCGMRLIRAGITVAHAADCCLECDEQEWEKACKTGAACNRLEHVRQTQKTKCKHSQGPLGLRWHFPTCSCTFWLRTWHMKSRQVLKRNCFRHTWLSLTMTTSGPKELLNSARIHKGLWDFGRISLRVWALSGDALGTWLHAGAHKTTQKKIA